ncbi:MAG TPA: hypothetical protein VIY48_05755 [Candidatus Paceibacterota bacterium]
MSAYLRDLIERVAATAAFTFLSAFNVTDLSSARSAGVAAAAASLSLLKGVLARYIGDESAGLK